MQAAALGTRKANSDTTTYWDDDNGFPLIPFAFGDRKFTHFTVLPVRYHQHHCIFFLYLLSNSVGFSNSLRRNSLNSSDSINRFNVWKAILKWEQSTCINFMEVDPSYSGAHLRFVRDADSCSSHVGKVSSTGQDVFLTNECENQVLAHAFPCIRRIWSCVSNWFIYMIRVKAGEPWSIYVKKKYFWTLFF